MPRKISDGRRLNGLYTRRKKGKVGGRKSLLSPFDLHFVMNVCPFAWRREFLV